MSRDWRKHFCLGIQQELATSNFQTWILSVKAQGKACAEFHNSRERMTSSVEGTGEFYCRAGSAWASGWSRETCAEGSASQARCTEGSVGSFAKLGHQIPSFELLELGEGPTLHLPKCSTKSDHSKGFRKVKVKVASKS